MTSSLIGLSVAVPFTSLVLDSDMSCDRLVTVDEDELLLP